MSTDQVRYHLVINLLDFGIGDGRLRVSDMQNFTGILFPEENQAGKVSARNCGKRVRLRDRVR